MHYCFSIVVVIVVILSILPACSPSGELEVGGKEVSFSEGQSLAPAPAPAPVLSQPSPAPTPESSTAATPTGFNVTPGLPFALSCSETALNDLKLRLLAALNTVITPTCDSHYDVSARIDLASTGSSLLQIINVLMEPKGKTNIRESSRVSYKALVRTPTQIIDLGGLFPVTGGLITPSVKSAIQSRAVLEGSSFGVAAMFTLPDGNVVEFPIYSLVMRIKPSG